MGVKGIAYFLICEHYEGWGYTGMIDYAGNTTGMYDKIKTVNEGVNAMKGVYLNYGFDGLMLCNYDKGSSALSAANCTGEITSHEDGYLVAAEHGNKRSQVAIGCFTHETEAGESGYYVVNLNYKTQSKVTLTFGEAVSYQLWGSEGLEDVGAVMENADGTYTLALTLEDGEGIFLKVSEGN